MPTGTVNKKSKQLLEDLCHRLSLTAYSDATKLRFQMEQQTTVAQVYYKKVH